MSKKIEEANIKDSALKAIDSACHLAEMHLIAIEDELYNAIKLIDDGDEETAKFTITDLADALNQNRKALSDAVRGIIKPEVDIIARDFAEYIEQTRNK